MPKALWIPNGRKLAQRRVEQGYPVRELARLSGVDEKTIRAIEAGQQESCRQVTLESLAGVLKCDWRNLLLTQRTRRRRRRLADDLQGDWFLRRFIEAERDLDEPLPPITVGGERVGAFGAIEMAEAVGAPRSAEGKRYYVTGEVNRQGELSPLDEIVLGLPEASCARFEILRRIETVVDPFAVTVVTRSLEDTRVLQQHSRSGLSITAIVRVVVASRGPDEKHVFITNLDGGGALLRPAALDGERWRRFEPISSDGRPAVSFRWALLVESLRPTGQAEKERVIASHRTVRRKGVRKGFPGSLRRGFNSA
jgi:transcriptional regulator with XRE-family HTH domain